MPVPVTSTEPQAPSFAVQDALGLALALLKLFPLCTKAALPDRRETEVMLFAARFRNSNSAEKPLTVVPEEMLPPRPDRWITGLVTGAE